MQCTKCGHSGPTGKFCVKCGASLAVAAEWTTTNDISGNPQASQAAQAGQGAVGGQPAFNQPNPQIEQAKQAANQFINLFVQVMKRPSRVSEQTNAGLMTSGIIAMALFALLAPLVIYFDVKTYLDGDAPFTFGEAVLQPFMMLLVVSFLVNVFIYFALKLGNVAIGIKEVIARFGAFTIPSIAILLIGFLLAVMSVNPMFVLCLFGLAFFAWIAAIGSTIYSYKQAHTGGLDPFYGVLGTITAALLVFYLFRDVLLGDFVEGLMGIAMNLVFRQFFGGF